MEQAKMARIWFWLAMIEGLALIILLASRPSDGSEAPTPGAKPAASQEIHSLPPAPGQPDLADSAPSLASPSPGRRDLPQTLDPDDPLGILVSGTVTDLDGVLIDGCRLAFQPEEGDIRRCVAEDGLFSIVGLEPGVYQVSATRTGFKEESAELDLSADQRSRRIDFVLTPSLKILVRFVTPDGASFLEAARVAGIGSRWDLEAIATEGPLDGELPPDGVGPAFGLGRWLGRGIGGPGTEQVPAGSDGILWVEAAPPFVVSAVLKGAVLASVPIPEPVPSLAIEISLDALRDALASIRFAVVDARTSQPLTGFSWSLSPKNAFSLPVVSESSEVLQENLSPGWYELELSGKEYAALHYSLLLAAGEHRDLGTIAMPGGVTLSGQVVDDTGQPVGGARIFLVDLDRGPPSPRSGPLRTYSCKDQGEFALKGMPPDRLLLFARGGAAIPTLVDARMGDVAGIRVVQQGGVKLSLAIKPASPGSSTLLTIYQADGVPLSTLEVTSERSWPIELMPGTYSVAWSKAGGPELGSSTIVVSAASTVIEIALP